MCVEVGRMYFCAYRNHDHVVMINSHHDYDNPNMCRSWYAGAAAITSTTHLSTYMQVCEHACVGNCLHKGLLAVLTLK
jgi:hypothetical protein